MRWRWQRWRARHYLHIARELYREDPTPANQRACARAEAYLARVEAIR
jgi:hypothetical protein